MSRFRGPSLRLGSMLAIVAVWQIGAMLVADPRMLPGPLAVAASMYGHATDGALFHHIGVTLARVAVSFVIAMAVGAAVGRNPLAVVIPCHRVVGAKGALTGYASGLDRKRWLLNHEATALRMPEKIAAAS